MKNVLMIVGSLRKQSFNEQLARRAEECIGQRASVTWLNWTDVPLLNQDIEDPAPQTVQDARDAVLAADGIFICTPEYNFNIPGGLKNLLDWLSRPADPTDRHSAAVTKDKVVAICSAAGKSAGVGVRGRLAEMLGFLGCKLIDGEGVGFVLDAAAFQTNKLELIEDDLTKLQAHVDTFLAQL